jgi:hypothetical protein
MNPPRLEEVADALLYLGPRDSLTRSRPLPERFSPADLTGVRAPAPSPVRSAVGPHATNSSRGARHRAVRSSLAPPKNAPSVRGSTIFPGRAIARGAEHLQPVINVRSPGLARQALIVWAESAAMVCNSAAGGIVFRNLECELERGRVSKTADPARTPPIPALPRRPQREPSGSLSTCSNPDPGADWLGLNGRFGTLPGAANRLGAVEISRSKKSKASDPHKSTATWSVGRPPGRGC